jgi:hypothetical protein
MTPRRALLGVLCSGLVGAAFALPCFFSPLFDDAYIHARIAEQLLSTGSAGFNPGALLKTDSATGYLLLLAALTALTTDAVLALRLIQALSVTLFVVQSYRLCLVLQGRLTWTHAALSLSSLSALLWAAYGGMETSTAALCLVACASEALHERHARALFFASLAACLRLELSLFLFYYAAACCLFGTERPRILLASWPLLACLAFDLVAYRSVIPQAALAKSLAYHLPLLEAARLALSVGFEQHVLLLGALYASVWVSWLSQRLSARAFSFCSRADARASSFCSRADARASSFCSRADARASTPIVEGLMLQTAFLIVAWTLSRSIMFPWYVATFATALGIAALFSTRALPGAPGSERLLRVQRFSICTLQLVIGLLSAAAVSRDLGFVRDELPSGARAERYRTLGAALYAHCPGCTLASSEIGGLGYAFRGKVFDGLGLADQAALRFHPLRVPTQRASYRVGAIPPAYIALRDPDFVVSMPLFSEAFRASEISARFIRYDCALVPEQPSRTLWGDALIQVFAKRALPARVLAQMRCVTARGSS